jgi:renalase
MSEPVTIVGAGMAGAACAVVLRAAGADVTIVERGRAPGGRMASPTLHGRRVDIGAGYFTVRDAGFQAVVDQWATRGLVRPWTDTFAVLAPDTEPATTTGPTRWATPNGLRSLVRDLLESHGIDVQTSTAIDTLPSGPTVLAMPDPQASRLVEISDEVPYAPVIAIACAFAERDWPFTSAAFVNDHPDITFIADDGSRRGDGAAVLVAHTTAARARRHLDTPDDAIAPVVAALRDLLGSAEPEWTHAHRWIFAQPTGQHAQTFGWVDVDGRRIGLAGDQWCPAGPPRVESAWRSGTDLAHALATGWPIS